MYIQKVEILQIFLKYLMGFILFLLLPHDMASLLPNFADSFNSRSQEKRMKQSGVYFIVTNEGPFLNLIQKVRETLFAVVQLKKSVFLILGRIKRRASFSKL